MSVDLSNLNRPYVQVDEERPRRWCALSWGNGGSDPVWFIQLSRQDKENMVSDHPEKVTGIDLSDEDQIAEAKPVAVGDTAEELLDEDELLEDEEETEEDEGRAADST